MSKKRHREAEGSEAAEGIVAASEEARPSRTTAHRHASSAVGGPAKASGQEHEDAAKGTFRFWHEERRFKGSGERCIVQQALFASGGVRTGGYPKTSPIPGPLGSQRPTDWDLLWAPARLALQAIPHMQPGQLVSAVPGLFSLTRKRKLPLTLKRALGTEVAATIVPLSFSLPEELTAWRACLGDQPGAMRKLWMLKTAQHLGRGLKLLPGEEALMEVRRSRRVASAALAMHKRNPPFSAATIASSAAAAAAALAAAKRRPKPYVLAQHYVGDPLLINGCKSGIRVWVLVSGVDPLRAYLHANGLVLFSLHQYDSASWRGTGGNMALGHVTNYAQNMDGAVWDLHQLEAHLGTDAFQTLWDRITKACALTVAAALGSMRAESRAADVPSNGTFELLGLDFLVDSSLHPWLLEVNGTPSLAVEHADAPVEDVIRTQKVGMVDDTFALLGCRNRFQQRYAALRTEARWRATNETNVKSVASFYKRLREMVSPSSDMAAAAAAAAELACLGRYIPLMPHFPYPDAGATAATASSNGQSALHHHIEAEAGRAGHSASAAAAVAAHTSPSMYGGGGGSSSTYGGGDVNNMAGGTSGATEQSSSEEEEDEDGAFADGHGNDVAGGTSGGGGGTMGGVGGVGGVRPVGFVATGVPWSARDLQLRAAMQKGV